MIKVLTADDHAVIREGIKRILARTSDITVADEASTGQEVLHKVLENDYDVVLLDITMPGTDGFHILKQLASLKPSLRILILSVHPEEQFAVRALRAGAYGYMNKEKAPDELIGAIRKVSSGGRYITSTLAEGLAVDLSTDSEEPSYKKLSDREFQVLRMIASGKTQRQIAQEISLSVKTISTYRSRILDKLNMKTDAQLTYYAIQNGLIV